ncbi:MAG: LOG family protein [Nitrospiraceae bacterium]|nr:LOG family protein [Nitrospiraceae bacterium]
MSLPAPSSKGKRDRAGTRGRPVLTNEQVLSQVQSLLDTPADDLQHTLIKEMLTTVLRLKDTPLDTLDLKILNRTLRELRYAFTVFGEYRDRRKVSIFGSARTQLGDPDYRLATDFGRRIVEAGYMVITGAADGIMGAAQEGAGREQSFGVNIMLPFEQGANATIADDPKLVNFKYFFTRKLMFLKESQAVALFPGGFGTHDEGFEALTLVQTGKAPPQPIVFLHAPGSDYWHEWNRFVTGQLLARKLINEEDLSLFKIFDSAAAAVDEITAFCRVYHSIRFVDRLLVMRLKQRLSDEQLDRLNAEFADLLKEGAFEQRSAFPNEADEPEFLDLPRLVFHSHRRSAGRLRQLIDRINGFSESGQRHEARG